MFVMCERYKADIVKLDKEREKYDQLLAMTEQLMDGLDAYQSQYELKKRNKEQQMQQRWDEFESKWMQWTATDLVLHVQHVLDCWDKLTKDEQQRERKAAVVYVAHSTLTQ